MFSPDMWWSGLKVNRCGFLSPTKRSHLDPASCKGMLGVHDRREAKTVC